MMNNKSKQRNALAYALKLLNIRPYTKEEMRRTLSSRGYPIDEIKQAISRLIKLDYLNDVKFLESWCYYRQRVSPRGRWFVKKELYIKGISSHDLEKYFDIYYPMDEEKNCIEGIIQKLAARKIMPGNNLSEEDSRKIISCLMRKGFSQELVFHALDLMQSKQLDIDGKK